MRRLGLWMQRAILVGLGLVWLGVAVCAPITSVAAQDVPLQTTVQLAPLFVTEVQAGSAASASEEFIELTNTTDAPIDLSLHAWELELASTTATNWDNPLRTIPLSGTVAPGQTYIVASQFASGGQTVHYLPATAGMWFSAGISAAAGHVRLTYNTNQPQSDSTCSATETVVDELEWSAPKNGVPATPSLDGRPVFVTPKSTGIPAGSSLQRYLAPDGQGYVDSDNDQADFILAAQPTPAAANASRAASLPAAPQSPVALPLDACDPNPVVPPSTGDGTGNEDPAAPPADTPPDAPAPTPPNSGLAVPQITELLPNPAAPQTDGADEFIELYNPNDVPFALGGYALQAGLTTLHTYQFPDGTALAPHAYGVFYAANTGLSLSNSGGQVALLDPSGAALVAADAYGTAKDGQAWALVDDVWQWTTTPTPNQPNVLTQPAPAAKAAAAKKTGSVKAASTAKSATKPAKAATKAAKTPKQKVTKPKSATAQTVASTLPNSGQHLNLLAVVGVIAVLYGAYEYRHDVANKYRLFREYRTARRKDRPGT